MLLALALAGCPTKEFSTEEDTDTGTGTGAEPGCALEVSPESIDFGPIEPGDVAAEQVRVSNVGGEACQIHGVSLRDGEAFALSAITAVNLAPGSAAAFDVSFEPFAAVDYTDTVTLQSNDADEPSIDIPLSGQAR